MKFLKRIFDREQPNLRVVPLAHEMPLGTPAQEMPAVAAEPDEEAREKFDALFRGIKLRILTNPPAIPLSLGCGTPLRVGIAPDPIEVADRLLRRSDTCAICGEVTMAGERIAASLLPEFENHVSYLEGVWVHQSCLDSCIETDEQRGIPW